MRERHITKQEAVLDRGEYRVDDRWLTTSEDHLRWWGWFFFKKYIYASQARGAHIIGALKNQPVWKDSRQSRVFLDEVRQVESRRDVMNDHQRDPTPQHHTTLRNRHTIKS